MSLAFKDRIALQYMLVTATLVAVVYLLVFGVVRQRVYAELDKSLLFEANKHGREITIAHDSIVFARPCLSALVSA